MLKCLRKISRAEDSMSLRRIDRRLGLVGTVVCVALCLMAPSLALASEYHDRNTFGGLPVPGATITATQGSQKNVTVSDQQGNYTFPDHEDGRWKMQLELR